MNKSGDKLTRAPVSPCITKIDSFCGLEQKKYSVLGGASMQENESAYAESLQAAEPEHTDTVLQEKTALRLPDDMDSDVMHIAQSLLLKRVDDGELDVLVKEFTDRLEDDGAAIQREMRTASFIVENLQVAKIKFMLGERVVPPDINQIAETYGMEWLAELFIDWDTDLSKLSRDTVITAVLRRNHPVIIKLDGSIFTEMPHVPEGKRAASVLKDLIDRGGFREPFFEYYAVRMSHQIITEDSVIEIETRAATGKHKVVFCVNLDLIGIDKRGLSEDELRKAAVIGEASVCSGNAAPSPDETVLASKGLKMPFNRYYEWDSDFSSVTEDMYVYAKPIAVTDRIANTVSDASVFVKENGLNAFMQSALFSSKRMVHNCFDWVREKRLEKIFKLGIEIQSEDFTFSLSNGELMLMTFGGVSMDVIIPAYVNEYPVKYISKEFLNGGFGIVNNYKWRSIKKVFSAENVGKMCLDDVKSIAAGIRSLELPNSLTGLPSHCFYGCASLNKLILPENLQFVAPTAFDFCKIDKLIFNGPCPRGLELCMLKSKVYVRKKYFDTFSHIVLV